MNNILNTILKDTYTLTLLKSRVRTLKSYLLNYFFAARAQDETTLPPQDLNWLKSLPPFFYQQFNKDNVYKIFADLESNIAALQPLIIYLSFPADDSSATQIGIFARKTFGSPRGGAGNMLLLDTKFDPNLIAGIALSWKGIYQDYSLRAKIEGRKAEILEEFKKYLR